MDVQMLHSRAGLLFEATADRSERIRQLDLCLQRRNPPLGFPRRQVLLELFWLIRLGAERAERRQLAGRHRGVDLVGERVIGNFLRFFAWLRTLNLKFVLYLFL